jgi:hypothetical protein
MTQAHVLDLIPLTTANMTREQSCRSRHWHLLAPSAACVFKCFPSIFVTVCLRYLNPCGLIRLLPPLLRPRGSLCLLDILKFFSVCTRVLCWQSDWRYSKRTVSTAQRVHRKWVRRMNNILFLFFNFTTRYPRWYANTKVCLPLPIVES